ncbi:MAG: hypothetical protein ACT4SY_02585 [Hyphomicrobiales bacterium]
MMCRWLEKFITPRISKAAADRALELGISLQTLRGTKWHQQAVNLKDPKRQNFHWEHFVPVKQLAQQVLNSKNEPVERIVDILREAEIVWVTKDEDGELARSGCRSRRPDPYACYKNAGIVLIDD